MPADRRHGNGRRFLLPIRGPLLGWPRALLLGAALLIAAVLTLAPMAAAARWLLELPAADSLAAWFLKRKVAGLLVNSLIIGITAAVAALAAGVPFGLALAGRRGRPARADLLLALLPLAVPPYLAAGGWNALLGRGGWLPDLLHGLGLAADTLSLLGGPWACGFILAGCYLPIAVLMTAAGTLARDPAHEEAARFSLTEGRILQRITLPLLAAHIGGAGITLFLLAVTDYGVASLLGVPTLVIRIYSHFAIYQQATGAVWLALPLAVVCLAGVIVLERLWGRRTFFSLTTASRGTAPPPGTAGCAFQAVSRVLPLAAATVPLAYLASAAAQPAAAWSAVRQAAPAIAVSVALALAGSLVLTLIAGLTGYAQARTAWLRHGAVRGLMLLPFALPSVLSALGIIGLWNRPGPAGWLYDGPAVVVLLWGARYLPLAQRLLADHLRRLAPSQEEAALAAGLTWTRTLGRVVWPQARTGWLAVWAVLYIFCLSELGGLLLVIPPGLESLPVRLYNLMHYGASVQVAAVGLAQAVLTLVPLAALVLLAPGRERG